jgi:hypothetical protein
MPQSIFLSYVHEDKPHRDNVERWVRQGLLGPNIVTTAEFVDLRQMGERAVEDHLKPKIRGAAIVLCLVGQDTHNHSWVRYELQVAASLGKRIILARIPNTTGLAPEGFRHLPIVALDPSTLRALIQ